ncbi:hypothetical protein JAU75_23620 [Ochrobactrum sp. Q0168]|uniref:hypothetical protein n=1 Tax=Ochrobactrum sp. Q0168 TaxID=2793241 RepID=UPI0018EA64A6|nr:hypothetical protein [Ochrobactrum sp. Q0168]
MGQQNSRTKLSRPQVSQWQRHLLWLSSAVFVSTLTLPLPVKAETWVGGAGFWDSVVFWQEGTIPNGVGDVATFNGVGDWGFSVALNGHRTIGELNLSWLTPGISSGYIFYTGALTFAAANGNAAINVANGARMDFAPTVSIELASNTVFNTSEADSYVSSSSSITGPGALIKEGPGTVGLFARNSFTGGTRVEDGNLFAGAAGLSSTTPPIP